jgi:RNA polymerase sigma-70 factor (ECF subfamily)
MELEEDILERLAILRFQAGDRKAFEALIQRHYAPLRYFVRRLVADAEDTDDIVQYVWLKVYTCLTTLRDPRAFKPWLYQIARNKAYRSVGTRRNFSPLTDDMPAASDLLEETFTADMAAAIHKHLAALCPEHREVVLLRFLEEMSYEAIAEVVGCNIGTVRSRIYYAKRTLRKKIEEDNHGCR